jgi:hypothetical protein
LIFKNLKLMVISNALDTTKENYMKTHAIVTVYVAQNISPEFSFLHYVVSLDFVI